MIFFLRKFQKQIQRYRGKVSVYFIFVFLITSILFGTYMVAVEGISFIDVIYYLVTTATTVGYGDISPKTEFGKVLSISYMVIGIMTLTVLIGIAGERMYEVANKIKLGRIKMKNGVKLMIVGYPNEDKVKEIVSQLRADKSFEDDTIVCVSNRIDEKPDWFDQYNVHFIKGLGSDVETLHRANIMQTEIALILAQDPIRIESDDYSSSAIAVIEKLNSNVHTIVERVRKDTLLFETSGCDVIARVSSPEVLAQEILDPGAFEFEASVFSNETPGTQFNLVYDGDLIDWKDLAVRFIMLGAIPEGYRPKDKKSFNMLPHPQDGIFYGTTIKYRASERINPEDLLSSN